MADSTDSEVEDEDFEGEDEDFEGEDRDEKFFHVLRYFWDSMEAVFESATFAHQNAQQLDDRSIVVASIAGRLLPGATEEQRKESAKLVHELFIRRGEGSKDDLENGVSVESRKEQMEERKREFEEIIDRFMGINSDPSVLIHYLTAYMQAERRPERLPVIFASLLTSAVGNFEVLIAGAIRGFLFVKPDALRSDDAKYSLAEIESYERIQDFREACIDRYSETVLRGSFEDWMKWFEKNLKINLNDIVAKEIETLEIFQRRHLFVHNGGVVNRLYLSKLSQLPSPPLVGTKLIADISYLLTAIENITAIGVLLIARVVCKIGPSEDERDSIESFASGKAFECLTQGRYQLTIDITSGMLEDCLDEGTRLIMRVNRWIAQKRLFGLPKIALDIENWQTGTLEPKYKLAKFALLDQHAEALSLGNELLANKQLDQESWDTWPLFSDVRIYEKESALQGAQSANDD